ncbi:MAG: Ig-like domain-containing protein [Desulfobulbaceae bacterium]|nr:Ig-like domain-containing protein [Desulfobulbaceae bacterium]
MAEAEKDDWLDALESPEDNASVPDQSDIDDLLFDFEAEEQPMASSASEEKNELDQSAIDELLPVAEDTVSSAPPDVAAPEAIDNLDLGSSDIDDLLASPQKTAPKEETDPDQDEIDKLFSEMDSGDEEEENPFLAEEINFSDVLDTEDSAPQGTDLDFGSEEFKMDDGSGIPDFSHTATVAPSIDEPTARIDIEPAVVAATIGAAIPGGTSKFQKLFANRKLLFGVGGSLAALLLLGGVYLMKGHSPNPPKENPPEVTKKAHQKEQVPAEAPPVPAKETVVVEANAIPTVDNLELTMPGEQSELSITLTGHDPEGERLEYVFQSMPEHGKLSGHPPTLTYTPRPDFIGQDVFTIKATDGKNISLPASVTITRLAAVAPVEPAAAPEPAKPEPTEASVPVSDKPKTQEIILAKSKSYSLTSAKSQTINWKKIWNETNFVPYKSDVRVRILTAPKHGSLITNKSQSTYTPDQSFRGTDSLTYQFSLGKLTSKSKSISISVHRQNNAPQLFLRPIAQSYTTGDTVFLSASQTKDENRDTVTFTWEQLAGIPVVLKTLSGDGSQVSFVAPSNFNTVNTPSLLIRVTATDQEGASASREITITTKSRRNSAIWLGNQG